MADDKFHAIFYGTKFHIKEQVKMQISGCSNALFINDRERPMLRRILLLSVLFMSGQVHAAGDWQLPADKGLVDSQEVATILGANDYPETSGYSKKIDYIHFDAYGQQYTQVVVTL